MRGFLRLCCEFYASLLNEGLVRLFPTVNAVRQFHDGRKASLLHVLDGDTAPPA